MREMKDSGVAWIGKIPAEWQLKRIKYLRNGEPDSFIDGDWIESPYITDSGIRYLTTGNVGDGIFKRQGNGYITDGTFKELNCKLAYPGDLVISRLNAPYGRACILPFDEEKYVLAVDIVILRTNENKSFLCYLAQCEGYQNIVQDGAKGTTMRRISRVNLGNVILPIPPRSVQSVIADFLDRKCTEIDAVLEKIRASIEEYKKLKHAIITQAVTKGIRGDRPIKESGIEWLGEIPVDWEVYRGKRLFYETNERSETGSEELLTVSHITGITLRSQKNVNMFMSESLVGYKVCHIGDIAANTMWMWQGAIGVSAYHGVISPSYNTYRQRNNDFDPQYLDYLLRIRPLVDMYNACSTGITASRLRLYPEQFLAFEFPAPPLEEQQEIVDYLSSKVYEMDTLIQKKKQFLAELGTYKKSLIYKYVTGKKAADNFDRT